MPRLWGRTIASHRDAVSEAIFAATAALMHKGGISALSMAGIARKARIGRATLYKYFSDLDEVLVAWHERVVAQHVAALENARNAHDDPIAALQAVLELYAEARASRGGHDGFGWLHALQHVQRSHDHVRALVRDLIVAGVKKGKIRKDLTADELAGFVVAALACVEPTTGSAVVKRIVAMVLRAIAPRAA